MAFNSDTYHANKCRREAAKALADARAIKTRAARGEAYEFELRRVPLLVMQARNLARLSRIFASCARMDRQERARRGA